jgi:pimeloyl-ACP methyl ester carboxylesterase
LPAITWTSGSFATGGEDICYERAGEGPAVVFSHGLGGNHAVWFQQLPVFAERFTCVTWDQRGFGRSTNRKGKAGPAAAVDDIGALLDHLGIDRAHLVGQSMGGWAVLGYALRAPERVASLVITDSTAGVMSDRIAEIVIGGTRASLPRALLGSHPAIGGRFSAEEPTKTFLYQEIGSFRDPSVTDADMVVALYATRYDIERVRELGLPVLLVVGAEDDLIPPEAVHELGTQIPGARVIEIPGAGHSPYFECPEAWNTAVLSFLAEVAEERGVRHGAEDR